MTNQRLLSVFIFFTFAIWGVDYDCVVVGSSPFSLFEALYQSHSGNRVLILEKEERCGGAWKGISVCGIPYADLGCHQIGQDLKLKTFLEIYAGCKIVSLDNPKESFSKETSGLYFSRGCYELIDHLLKLISKTDIVLLTRTRVENISIDRNCEEATVQTKEGSYTTRKIILTPMSQLSVSGANEPSLYPTSKYYHLYLLIQDPTPPRFHYRSKVDKGASRMMNLTPFVDLEGTGRQLIVIQMTDGSHLARGSDFLEMMQKQSLIDAGAYILESETYIYEAGSFHCGVISKVGAERVIEVLQTGHFQQLTTYIPKWEKVLKPYSEFFTN